MNPNHFGDIIDCRKYGLLRLLGTAGQIQTAVCWMLTPDDAGNDGGDTQYLRQPNKFRRFDPELFDFLYEVVIKRKVRNVRALEGTNILPRCRFFSDLVPGHAGARREYFERLLELARGAELVFFDPDTGIKLESAPVRQKRSTKHLFRDELSESFAAGHSLLI